MQPPVGKKASPGGREGAGAPRAKPKGPERRYSAVELGSYLIGSVIYVRAPEEEAMYVKAVVKAIEGQQLEVDINGKTEKVDVDRCLNANVGIDPATVTDLAKLPHANEACALEVIRERYLIDQIYVSGIYGSLLDLL